MASNRTNLVITSKTSNDKKVTTTITYVNPQATNEQLIELGRTIIALTTDTPTEFIKDTREVLV